MILSVCRIIRAASLPACLRFVVFRRLLLTVSVCFRQVCKRQPFMTQNAAFCKAKGRRLQAGRPSFETVTIAVLSQNNSAYGLGLTFSYVMSYYVFSHESGQSEAEHGRNVHHRAVCARLAGRAGVVKQFVAEHALEPSRRHKSRPLEALAQRAGERTAVNFLNLGHLYACRVELARRSHRREQPHAGVARCAD